MKKLGQFTAMISSTALDLPEHRAAVKEACISSGVFPIGMEQVPARDASGVAVSLEMVELADVYLGVYAWRYGWVPDGKGISVTEMEFDRAVERKATGALREILIFAAHKDHPFTFADVETDNDAQMKLSAFKAKATNGRVRKEFRSVEELRRLVSEALHQFLHRERTNEPPTTVSTPRTPIPHNLPALQPFFGREDELSKIADALDPESRTWGALIDGAGGMGKTSLAVRAAYDVPPDAFDKIVFVSLKSRELDDDGLRDLSGFLISGLAELLNELACELGHADIAKAAEDRRPRLLLDALRNTKTLLILDNLESLTKPERDTVFTFIKKLPSGCKAILTSRGRIGSGAEELILDKLSEPAALATLAKLAESNPALARTSEAERLVLYRETGGKPLLLRWTAGQIGRGKCLTFSDAIAYLRSCSDENNPLEFIFGDLVEDFSDAETRVLCALTYFTLPARVEHVRVLAEPISEKEEQRLRHIVIMGELAVLVGSLGDKLLPDEMLTGAEVESALKSLVNRSLVVPSEELKTFTLVPLVADFLRKKKPEIIAETGNRLEKRAFALVVENGYKNFKLFAKLDTAWPTIAAALPRFLVGPNPRRQTICDALKYFFEYTMHWDEWLALHKESEIKSKTNGDLLAAGEHAYVLGHISDLRRQSAAVLEWAGRAFDYWSSAGAPAEKIAKAIHLRAHGHNLAKNYPAAIVDFKEALALRSALWPIEHGMITDLCCLASAEKDAGDFDSAEHHLIEALGKARSLENEISIAYALVILANLEVRREDWTKAEAYCREALPLYEKYEYPVGIAGICELLAKTLVRQGKKAEGLPHVRRAVDIYARLCSPDLDEARVTLAECES